MASRGDGGGGGSGVAAGRNVLTVATAGVACPARAQDRALFRQLGQGQARAGVAAQAQLPRRRQLPGACVGVMGAALLGRYGGARAHVLSRRSAPNGPRWTSTSAKAATVRTWTSASTTRSWLPCGDFLRSRIILLEGPPCRTLPAGKRTLQNSKATAVSHGGCLLSPACRAHRHSAMRRRGANGLAGLVLAQQQQLSFAAAARAQVLAPSAACPMALPSAPMPLAPSGPCSSAVLAWASLGPPRVSSVGAQPVGAGGLPLFGTHKQRPQLLLGPALD